MYKNIYMKMYERDFSYSIDTLPLILKIMKYRILVLAMGSNVSRVERVTFEQFISDIRDIRLWTRFEFIPSLVYMAGVFHGRNVAVMLMDAGGTILFRHGRAKTRRWQSVNIRWIERGI